MPSVPAFRLLVSVAAAAAFSGAAAMASSTPATAPTYRYADLADLAIAAPMTIDATVRDAVRIKGAEAANVAPGRVRLYVTVDVNALIRGSAAVPPRVGYLYDAPLDSDGKLPKLKKQRVLLYARGVAGAGDQIQLVSRDAQLTWSPAIDAVVRSIARDLTAADSPPAIATISNAFHAAGTLPGEGETQIFLKTSGQPISLSITRAQNRPPVWTVSLNEVVDNALPPPKRDTFLWYRLACGLPAAVPADLLAGVDSADATAIRDDYALVKRSLGPCR